VRVALASALIFAATGAAVIAAIAPPLIAVGTGGVLLCCLFPRQLGPVALFGLATTAPLLNPAVTGSAADGRVYASAGFVVMLVACALGSVILDSERIPKYALAAVIASILYCLVMAFRPDVQGALPWLYRPLQPVLLSLAVILVTWSRPEMARRALTVLILAGTIGAGLGVANALFPPFDPYALTRPADLPWQAMVGSYIRATGGFVYPNVFGLFCAYLAVAAAAARLQGLIGLRLAQFAVLFGLLGTITSVSRASIGGLALGFLFVVWHADRTKRTSRIVGSIVFGGATLMALAQTQVGADVLTDRITDSTGQSFTLRQINTLRGLQDFWEHPFIGTGIVQSRLDNGVLLYLSMGGIVGFILLCAALVFVARTQDSGKNFIPLGSKAMIIVLLGSSLLQDSLGQTLSSYFIGLGLGLFSVASRHPESQRQRLDPIERSDPGTRLQHQQVAGTFPRQNSRIDLAARVGGAPLSR
jgi:hypothetical protein